jgi:DNA-binding Lrp family transcriptional regulator
VEILRQLQVNADPGRVAASWQVNLPQRSYRWRVNQLKRAGVIRKFVALVDRRQLALDVVAFVEIQLDRRNAEIDAAFRKAITREPNVISCYSMVGRFDYLLKVVSPDLPEFTKFAMGRLLRMPGVMNVRSAMVLESVGERTALPLDHLG